jgi:hypothetical protein
MSARFNTCTASYTEILIYLYYGVLSLIAEFDRTNSYALMTTDTFVIIDMDNRNKLVHIIPV